MTGPSIPRQVSPAGRRRVLKSALALTGAAACAPAVFAAQQRTVKFTLPWLAQGATAYVYIADERGFFKKRGLNVEISRGFGSLTASQAIANGQFDFGLVSASSTIVSAATGLPLVALGTTNYDAYAGVLMRSDSPIRTPKDLEGKRIGAVPASTEFPLWKAFAKKADIDAGKVQIIQADPRVLERTLVEKQIDAALVVASTSYAVAKAMGTDTRAFLWSKYGLPFYSNNILTRPDVLQRDPELCRAVTDALLEGLAYQLKNPDESLDIFLKKVPELTLTAGGREFSRLSQGFMLASAIEPEAIDHGLGYSDMRRVDEMIDLIMQYAVPPSAKRPSTQALFTNRFIGSVQLDKADWDRARQQTQEFVKLLA